MIPLSHYLLLNVAIDGPFTLVLFFLNLLFNWCIVELQYCFCCTAELISYTYIHSFYILFPYRAL